MAAGGEQTRSAHARDVSLGARIFTHQPCEPSGMEGYCRHGPGGRAAASRDLRNPYLCNRLRDFLHSKFCGIV